jgi:hypothetical protein
LTLGQFTCAHCGGTFDKDWSDAEAQARLLHLERDEDVSGVSGTGRVAEGVEFADGTVVLRWSTLVATTVIYDALADVETIVGHGGRTRIVFNTERKPMTTARKLSRMPVPTDAKDVVLGEKYTDLVTGIKGTAIIVYVHLTGCDQVCLSYVEGGKQEYITVDATRIAEITPSMTAAKGGPGSPPPSRIPR